MLTERQRKEILVRRITMCQDGINRIRSMIEVNELIPQDLINSEVDIELMKSTIALSMEQLEI